MMVIAHEFDVLKYVGRGLSRAQLFSLLIKRDADFAKAGRSTARYEYGVAGLWQGRWEELRVLGDKKGGATSLRVLTQPERLERLLEMVGVPVRVIHMARNPFDNIATMFRRGVERGRSGDLAWYVGRYLDHCAGCQAAEGIVGRGRVLRVRYEDLCEDPAGILSKCTAFLGEESQQHFLDVCAQKVAHTPSRTRESAPWTPALFRRVEQGIEQYDFLASYSF